MSCSRSTILATKQPDGIVYLIVDSEIFAYPHYGSLTNQQLIDDFASIDELESGLGLPDGSLHATLVAYNAAAERGEDPELHKHPDWLKPLTAAPYAAFDLGGRRVSADGEVLCAAGTQVPGLYAAGACASNLAQDSHGYDSGTCLGEASYFGRRSGRHAALAPVTAVGTDA